MKYLSIFVFVVSSVVAVHGYAQVRENKVATQIIDKSGYSGTLLVYRESEGFYQAGHAERATKAFIPASTFKIASAMIALDTNVIGDADTVIVWDGVERARSEINQDLDLKSAFRVSAVPHFQTLVRQIGPARMQQYIDALAYGNQDISGGEEEFWLQGNLTITPIAQIELLRRLYHNDLPVRQDVMNAVKDMMISEQTDSYVIRSKTGLAVLPGEHNVGWWVGWLEQGDDRVYFASALEADAPDADFIPARITMMREFLQTMNLLEQKI